MFTDHDTRFKQPLNEMTIVSNCQKLRCDVMDSEVKIVRKRLRMEKKTAKMKEKS